jgi:hypothetical protein
MRSCLIQLLITAAVIFALLWFGLPFGASWLATNALRAVGFTGTDTKVEVSANLPPRILLGHADKITLTSSQVFVGDLHAATIDLTLGDVDLFGRTAGTVTGTLTGVSVPAANGDAATIDKAVLAGSGTAATATLSISNAEVETLATSQLKAQTGIAGKVKLKAPDVVTVTINGQAAPGHLVVKDGALELVPVSDSLPTVTIIAAGGGNPFRFQSVAVGATSVTLVGTIDLQTLLGL